MIHLLSPSQLPDSRIEAPVFPTQKTNGELKCWRRPFPEKPRVMKAARLETSDLHSDLALLVSLGHPFVVVLESSLG